MWCGNRDVVKHGNNGFICRTKQEYCDIIQKIEKNEFDLNKIKVQARQTVEQEHDVELMAQEYFKIYSEGVDCY